MANPTQSLVQAVMNADAAQAKSLVEGGASLEEVDLDGQTPLLIAAMTDQFTIAEYLIAQGANIFATSEFGWTVGYAAETSRLVRGPEAEARQRVLVQLRDRGFPFPATKPRQVMKWVEEKHWPPAGH